jgi:hypothetical protein
MRLLLIRDHVAKGEIIRSPFFRYPQRTTGAFHAPPNGLPLSRGNRTRKSSTYDERAAVDVGCSGLLVSSCPVERQNRVAFVPEGWLAVAIANALMGRGYGSVARSRASNDGGSDNRSSTSRRVVVSRRLRKPSLIQPHSRTR